MDTDFVLIKESNHDRYHKFPLYLQRCNGDFLLYKPAGVAVEDIRIHDGLLPKNLYIEKRNKIKAIQEIQQELNDQLKQSIHRKNPEIVRGIVHSIMRVTLEEPVSGSIQGLKQTIEVLVDEYSRDFKLIRTLLDLATTDYTTVLHSVNVMALALAYANYTNLEPTIKRNLCLAALLHDVGKVYINSKVLQAPRPLTEKEFREIQLHTIKGFKIIDRCKFSDPGIKLTALQHHEKLDGSGYPMNSVDIVEFAQIVSITDCYEALTNDHRLYREALVPLHALEKIQSEIVDAGKFSKTHFKNFARLLVLFYN